MSDTTQISGTDAIRLVIEAGGALDFIDIVNKVQKRFRLDVTSAQVEQVLHDLATAEADEKPAARVSLAMTTIRPDEAPATVAAQPSQIQSTQPSQCQPPQSQTDNLGHALHFVKSVNGLTNAKRALAELESILHK